MLCCEHPLANMWSISTGLPTPPFLSSNSGAVLRSGVRLRRASARRWGGIPSNVEDVGLHTGCGSVKYPLLNGRPITISLGIDAQTKRTKAFSVHVLYCVVGLVNAFDLTGWKSIIAVVLYSSINMCGIPRLENRDLISQEPCRLLDRISPPIFPALGCGPNR